MSVQRVPEDKKNNTAHRSITQSQMQAAARLREIAAQAPRVIEATAEGPITPKVARTIERLRAQQTQRTTASRVPESTTENARPRVQPTAAPTEQENARPRVQPTAAPTEQRAVSPQPSQPPAAVQPVARRTRSQQAPVATRTRSRSEATPPEAAFTAAAEFDAAYASRRWLASRRFPTAMFATALAVMCKDTGKLMNYRQLLHHPDPSVREV